MNLEDRIRNKRKIDPRKAAAIALAIDIGRRIQQEFPQVAKDYRSGMYHRQIVRKYELRRRYNTNEETAKQAVAYALCGNSGLFKTKEYSGLIENEEELRILEHEHFVTRSFSS